VSAVPEEAGFQYSGSELDLFSAAQNWKAYWGGMLRPFVTGNVLDVGAGIGSNIGLLFSGKVRHWTALEPDQALVETMLRGGHPPECEIRQGTLASLPPDHKFDTILYIDVIEHIEDDRAEAAAAAARLNRGGRLIVLVPAHQFLFSPFDASIGHYRRYSRATLLALAPPGCRLEWCKMLDSVGFFASLANKIVLRASQPNAGQIMLWDRVMVPVSRILDRLLFFRFGKTVVASWTREDR
jgi:SAM-dependent methyltransferase